MKNPFFNVGLIPHHLEEYEGDPGCSVVNLDKNKILANVSSNYQLVPHLEAIKAVENAFEEEDIEVTKNKMFVGADGKTLRIRYSTNNKFKIPFDKSDWFVFIDLINSYDRSISFSFEFGYMRQICSNGLMALKRDGNSTIKLKHIKQNIKFEGINKNLTKFLENLHLVNHQFEKLHAQPSIPLIKLENLFPTEQSFMDFVSSSLLEKYYQEFERTKYAQLQAITDFASHSLIDSDSKAVLLQKNTLPFLLNTY